MKIFSSDLIINSPLDQFEVISLLSVHFPILGYITITITNIALYSIIVLIIIVGIHYLSNNENKLVPSKWSILFESIFTTVLSIVRDQIGITRERFFPFIYSLFVFILIANLIGNIPYNFTVTTSLIVSIGLSFTIFIGVTLLGLIVKKLSFFSTFVPDGTPLGLVPLLATIELVSYSARAFSLGIRLFANLVAGHSLLKILSTFLLKFFNSEIFIAIIALVPFSIFVALCGLELAVSIIQAYVFIVLTCSYIRDSLEMH
jgi:F-type H+-transporting ATPase subunit a